MAVTPLFFNKFANSLSHLALPQIHPLFNDFSTSSDYLKLILTSNPISPAASEKILQPLKTCIDDKYNISPPH